MSIRLFHPGITTVILFLVNIVTGYNQNAPVTTIGSAETCPLTNILVPVTVDNFHNIGSISLRIEYDPTVLDYQGASNINSNLTGIEIHDNVISSTLHKINIIWLNTTALSLPNGSRLFDLSFTYKGGTTNLTFNNSANNGIDCEYADQEGNPLIDNPTSVYYIDGSVTEANYNIQGNVQGADNVCKGQEDVIYMVTPVQNAIGYVWSLPPGTTIVSGSGTNAIHVNFSSAAVSGVVSVYATSDCGNGMPSSDLLVTVNPLNPVSVTIDASANPICQGTSVTFTASPVNGGSSPTYQWKVNGETIVGVNNVTYTYVPANGDQVSCVLTSDIACPSGNPAISNTVAMVVTPQIPTNIDVTDITINTGETECFNATRQITIAGGGTVFSVLDGGIVTFIAGERILFLPGTSVQSGGCLTGRISPNGPFCTPNPTKIAVISKNNSPLKSCPGNDPIKIFPNPTEGILRIVSDQYYTDKTIWVTCYNLMGEQIIKKESFQPSYELDLRDQPPGMYLLRVHYKDENLFFKILKK